MAAVIAMVEISQGSKTALERTMATMGANNLLIQSRRGLQRRHQLGVGQRENTDARAMPKRSASNAPAVVGRGAASCKFRGQVVRGNRNWVPMVIYGTTPAYLKCATGTAWKKATCLPSATCAAAIKVCVIGTTLVARTVPGRKSPIGKDIRVQNVSLRVVGVLGRKGANMMGMDQDDIVLAPWTTIKYRVSGNNAGGASKGSTSSSATAYAVRIRNSTA